MTLLILGVLLWALLHFFPVFMPDMRAGIKAKMGELPYKGLFSLLMLGTVGLMVMGWRSTEAGEELFYGIAALRHVTYVFVLIAIILFGASKGRSRIRRVIRHPMLTGVVVWGVGHLLVNNDPRSLVLFGGMVVWALISIVGINRRDGAYTPPEPWSWGREIRLLIISVVLYIGLLFAHPYFTGIALF